MSAVLFEPPEEFWAKTWRAVRLFGIPRYEAKKVNWRNAMLNLKGVLERYGIPFPTIPEVEISGQARRRDGDHPGLSDTLRETCVKLERSLLDP